MRVAIIKGLICLVAVLTIISTSVIIATNSEIEQDENQSKESSVIVTTQSIETITTTEKIEETTESITKETTEPVTEKPTEVETEKPTTTVVQTTTKSVETTKPKKIEKPTKEETGDTLYSASQFMNMGVIHWNGWKWTWYSERVLPGGGLNIPGRHADNSGYICDENNYICLSSSTLSKGTVINTPFGKNGKVYDSGCASDTVDVYVNW